MEFHSFVINSFVLIQFYSIHFLMLEGNYTILLFLHFFPRNICRCIKLVPRIIITLVLVSDNDQPTLRKLYLMYIHFQLQ